MAAPIYRDWNRIVTMMERGDDKDSISKYHGAHECELCETYTCSRCPLYLTSGATCDTCDSWWDIFTDWLWATRVRRDRALHYAKKIRDCVNKWEKIRRKYAEGEAGRKAQVSAAHEVEPEPGK